MAAQAGAVDVDEAEVALLEPQHGHVGRGADREVAQLLLTDLPGGVPGGAEDHFVQRHPQDQELAHDIEHVLDAGVLAAGMQVRRERIGEEPLLDDRHGHAPDEAAAAMTDVEDHPALASFEQGGIGVA